MRPAPVIAVAEEETVIAVPVVSELEAIKKEFVVVSVWVGMLPRLVSAEPLTLLAVVIWANFESAIAAPTAMLAFVIFPL